MLGIPEKPKLIAIVGSTASGKTSLSIQIAKKFNGEIISADSRQIYREMTIGTAKAPISSERSTITKSSIHEKARITLKNLQPVTSQGIWHYLIDIKNPNEDYSLAEYQHDAIAAAQDVIAQGKLPILTGGTGLYIKSVVENLDIPKTKADPDLRRKIEKEIQDDGVEAVFKKLVDLDPEAAYIVDPKNPRRVVRALEVTIATGKPFTMQRKKNNPIFDVLEIGITQPEDILRKRIDDRIDAMMRDGLVDEVKSIIKKYGKAPVALEAIGYREIIEYLDGKCSEKDAVAQMKINTWQYARRQMTWFRKDKKIQWIRDEAEAEEKIKEFLK
jgi:tRNA dimethylallyltransferase